jgi:hypothetical protein
MEVPVGWVVQKSKLGVAQTRWVFGRWLAGVAVAAVRGVGELVL